jgi:threonyl-tRNA synthetase
LLLREGLRVTGDYRAEKLGAKIRDAQLELIPYMLVVGPRDAQERTVSVRDRIEGDLGAMPIEVAVARLRAEVTARTVRQSHTTHADLWERGAENEY